MVLCWRNAIHSSEAHKYNDKELVNVLKISIRLALYIVKFDFTMKTSVCDRDVKLIPAKIFPIIRYGESLVPNPASLLYKSG